MPLNNEQFRQKALAEGFSPEEIDAFLMEKGEVSTIPLMGPPSASGPQITSAQAGNGNEQSFRARAKADGFSDAEIDAFLVEKRQLSNPKESAFLPRLGMATLTIPVRTVKNMIAAFNPETLKTFGVIGKDAARVKTQADILGLPGVPAKMRKEAAGKIAPAGEITSAATLAILTDTLGPLGFTFSEGIDPQTGEATITADHSFETVKEIAATEPERFLEMFSIVASGGSAALAKSQRFAKVAKALDTFASVSEPLAATGKAIGFALKPVRKATGVVVPQLLGITTGASPQSIRRAFRNPTPELMATMRGKTEVRGVLTETRDALFQIMDGEAEKYRARLRDVQNISEELDISPVHQAVNAKLKAFNIKRNSDGTLDFRQSALRGNTSAQTEIEEVVALLDDIGMQPGDATPFILDLTKQSLDNFYRESSQARSFVATARGAVRDLLAKNVKGYSEMTSDYAKMRDLVDEVNTVLSLDKSPDTAIRKINSALKENKELRLSLLTKLDEISESDLLGQVAGADLKSLTPKGFSRLPSVVPVLGGFTINPKLLFLMLPQSPRLVGEVMSGLGVTNQQIARLMELAGHSQVARTFASRTARQAAFVTGRTAQVLEGEVLQERRNRR